MTTENNTNPETVANPATQTLFRFVSLRNPQLAKTDGNTKFIFRDNDHKGIFDTMLDSSEWTQSGKSKIDFLTDKIKSGNFDFTKIYRTEDDLKKPPFLNLYDLTKILVESGSLTSLQVNGFDSQSLNMPFLWDSLIYQILTQEDFYLKELLTQMLQTLHYIDNYDVFSTEPDAKKKKVKEKEISSAKVVIPDFLFVDSASIPSDNQSNAFTVGSSAVGSQDYISGSNANSNASVDAQYFPTESMLKRQKVALASYEKAQLEDLKKELSKAQSIYRKQYSKAFELASKDYQNLIKPLYDDYDQSLLEVEATFTEEMTEAAKKFALSQVAKPEVPEFQFEFRRERDVSFLQSKLSETSLRSFVNLIGEYSESETLSGRLNNGEVLQENIVAIGEDQFVLPEDENQNFDEMLETINVKLSDLNETIYQNTEVEKQEYVSIGGVLIPVTNNNESSTNVIIRDAEFCAYENIPNSGIINIGGRMSIHSSSTFSDISYNVSNGNVVVREGSYHNLLRTNEGVLEISDLFNNQLSMADFNQSNTFVMKCKIDGLNTTLTVDISNQGCNRTELISVPNNSTTNSSNNTFVPKGFGIKRLGIADYLKVEQTTHAYVEGEVASIENIMAREYREKSTRRLRRNEVTETTSSDTEREQLTDTTTASRFEMQSEIAKMQQEATDIGVNASTGYSGGGFNINVAASYANHRSKEESMRQAVTQAQDVTARALDRVVTKVHQERIEKIIEEFEENNSHGFDNRKGDKHVVGVYRWVDKLMKNQVWDYGKRLMFEFAVPQPAKIHTLATASLKNGKVIEKPVDPRKQEGILNLSDYSKLSDTTLKHWTGIYNVEIDEKPMEGFSVNKSFSGKDSLFKGQDEGNIQLVNGNGEVIIPEGYIATEVRYLFDTWPHGFKGGHAGFISVAGVTSKWIMGFDKTQIDGVIEDLNVKDKLEFSFATGESPIIQGTLNITCEVTKELETTWQQKTFNAIIEAYETALANYNQEVAEEETKAGNIKETNANFYRQIEQDVLKHNCIAYMVDPKVLGTKLYDKENIENFEVIKNKNLDEYASLSKFMEQAFEWNIMSYDFYPYYWGAKEAWQALYQSESMDPLFRSFLQSGMARVVVTVRPGFEDAVQFYMATGRLWNGGEVPVIGDPMYLSIVDELKGAKGEAQGKPWITRLPTSLTILQAQSIGLAVSSALPFTKEDPALFENPEEVITESNFSNNTAMIESGADKQVAKIGLDEDSLQLTTEDDKVVSELSLDDLKQALE
ncbi:hypothetical protein [Epilithonimonas caeni]|uniref:hypothetical protein n=1 Tax=Epilithonimonas caeni TaxID=365343 RepID=UPI000A0384A5|nr:hypothetical protein [Epilithonimonas caeni]